MKLKRECRPIQSTDVKVNSCRCPKAQAAKVHLCSSVQNLSRVPVQTTTLEANKTPKGETERKRGQRREAASGRRGIHKPLKRKRGGGVGPRHRRKADSAGWRQTPKQQAHHGGEGRTPTQGTRPLVPWSTKRNEVSRNNTPDTRATVYSSLLKEQHAKTMSTITVELTIKVKKQIHFLQCTKDPMDSSHHRCQIFTCP